jgi:AbiV family abortive infection protein
MDLSETHMPSVTIFSLPAYRSPKVEILTEVEFRKAMNAAVLTARELRNDAEFLFSNGRYARAAALAVLALEEVGKIKILPRIFNTSDTRSRKIAWKEYRDHQAKSAEMITAGGQPGLVESEVRSDFGQQADALKQLGFYSNPLTSGEWAEPAKTVNRDHVLLAVQWAGAMVDQLREWESVAGR